MSAVMNDTTIPPGEELAPYRAICRTAVISAVLAAVAMPMVVLAIVSMRYQVSDTVWLGSWGAIFATAAFILGLIGARTVRRYPTEYTGGRLAMMGLLCGLVLAIVGSASATYTYSHEVPDGYSRVGFWELKPDPDEPELPIARKAIDLTGKPIFIKGYMHPGVASMGKVNHFILVPDMGTCCFGGQPKPTDMIEVFIPDGKERVAYSRHQLKLTGTFLLADHPVESLGLNNVWYHMQLDRVQ